MRAAFRPSHHADVCDACGPFKIKSRRGPSSVFMLQQKEADRRRWSTTSCDGSANKQWPRTVPLSLSFLLCHFLLRPYPAINHIPCQEWTSFDWRHMPLPLKVYDLITSSPLIHSFLCLCFHTGCYSLCGKVSVCVCGREGGGGTSLSICKWSTCVFLRRAGWARGLIDPGPGHQELNVSHSNACKRPEKLPSCLSH